MFLPAYIEMIVCYYNFGLRNFSAYWALSTAELFDVESA
jgi:hypothetical protein